MNEPSQSVGLQTPPAPAHGVRPVLPKPPAEQPPPKGRRGLWIWLVILVIAAGAAYYYWTHRQTSAAKPAGTSTGSAGRPGGGGRGAGGPIPVVAVKAQKGNIAVYYNGLGAVTPLATVADQEPGGRAVDDGALQRRRHRAAGRPAGRNRSASVSSAR